MTDLDVHLAAIAAADPEAFALWVAAAERPLRLSLRSFASAVDTEAVVQETLLRVWQLAPRIVPDGSPNTLLRFAIRAARNLAVSETRRLGTHRAWLEKSGLGAAQRLGAVDDRDRALAAHLLPTEIDPFLRAALAECRGALHGKPAAALTARLENAGGDADLTLAERLGMTLNTFLQNFTRARKLLGECLRGRGIDVAKELG